MDAGLNIIFQAFCQKKEFFVESPALSVWPVVNRSDQPSVAFDRQMTDGCLLY